MSAAVRIVEVGARDGLQNEPRALHLSVEDKRDFIARLAASGLRHIEGGAFVSPKAVPQMAGSLELAQALQNITLPDGVRLSWLVPNLRGLETAERAGATEIAVFIAASDAFSRANINATVGESLARLEPVIAAALAKGIAVRGYISTVFGYHDEPFAPQKVAALAKRLLEAGAYEVSLGDTTGIGTPQRTAQLIDALEAAQIPLTRIAMHLHDTGGRAIENVAVAYDRGIRVFDASAGGLGGCPYADSPKGNLATETLVAFLEDERGVETGVNRASLAEAARFMLARIGKN